MSESPEEQPSTGVLGRIGSWFSPWKGTNPKSPTENASPSGDQVPQSVGNEEGKESVSLPAGEQQWGEEKDLSSDPNPLRLSRDSFLCEEKDATQSAHRHDCAVSSAEAEEGGPKEEGFRSRKKKTGQSKEWEGSSDGTPQSGNPERNASHLTHHFSTSKQSIDRAHALPQAERQVQAPAGKQLHVYLEETSVIHCGQDTRAGQEVVCTKVTKSLQVLPKARSPPGSDLSSTSAENKRTNVTPASPSYYSALVGVSLKSHKDSQSEPEPDKEQTEVGGMGRKNAARRRYRKNSQGDGGSSPQEKMSPTTQFATEGVPSSDNSVDIPQGESPKVPMGGSTENSASEHSLTSQVSPGGGEETTSCLDTDKVLDNFQNSNSVIADSLACVVEGGTDMEDDDSLYRVERKTETPESKRRSIKVSRSEVKLFRKYVPLKPVQSPAEDNQDFTSKLKNDKEEKDKPQTETDGRLCDLKKPDEEPKAAVGRIADKISLFERQQVEGGLKRTFRTPRSADVSPVRTATETLKADCEFQRSRSAERHGAAGSSSVLLAGEKPLTIKERLKNLTEASKSEVKSAPVMTGMPKKSTTSVAAAASDLRKLESPGKLDTNEQAKTTAMSELALKPDGQDTTSAEVNVSTPKEQTTDAVTKVTDSVTLKPEDQGTKPDSAEPSVSAKGTSESSETSSNVGPQSKGPSRTGSRSKRRKSREYASPVSPNNDNKPTSKQEREGDREISLSALKRPPEKPLISETKQKALKKETEVFEKQKKGLDSSFIKKSIDKPDKRKEGLPESPVGRDEPDTAACSSGTKKTIDQDPAILPQQEEKAGSHSLTFAQQTEKTSNDCKGNSVFSPATAAEQPIQRTPPVEQESPVENPVLEKEALEQLESGGNGKERQQPQNKDTEPVNTAESKDVERQGKAGSEKTIQAERKDKEKPQQPLLSDKNTNKSQVSDGEQGFSGTEASVAEGVERKNAEKKEVTRPIKDTAKAKENQAEPASQTSAVISGPASVDLPVQTEHMSQTVANTTHPEIATVCAVVETNEVVSCSERDKAPSKGEKAAERSPELKTKSTEIYGADADPVAVSAKPQYNSASVEKVENSPDDSLTHGANDVESPSSKPIIKATAAVEEVSVKAANDSRALINLQTENTPAKELSTNSVSTSANRQEAEQDDGHKSSKVKTVSSEGVISGDRPGLAPSPLHSPIAEIAHSTPNSDAFKFSDHVTAASSLLPNEPPSVPNGDISPHWQLQHTVKKETVSNEPSQTPKAATSSDANKLVPGSIPHSVMKRLHLPRGLSKDDSTKHQDAPSSWLDVDVPRRKLKFPEAKLTSSGSESNILDASDELDDDDFVEKIKKLCAPFSLPPRKHNHLRPPQPPFALPAIREDRFEKTFDPDEFKFGLRKKKFVLDTTPSALAKLQSTEAKSGLKPARASLADRSLLLGSLDTDAWLKDKSAVKDDVDAKEEMDDNIRVKSRLEGSCVLSSLTSSSFRGKRNGVQTQAEGTSSAEVSPSRTPELSPTLLSQPPLPSPTATAPIKDTLANQSSVLYDKEEARAAEAVVSDSGPPFPSFNDIKLPDYLEKYLLREPAKPVQSTQEQESVNKKVTENMTTTAPGGEVALAGKPSPLLPDAVPPCFPEIPPTTHTTLPQQPGPQPQGTLCNHVRTARGLHKRPGKMVLFEKAEFGGQAYEIYRDVADATSLQFSPLISVKVIRGCWLLYEKPDFQGRSIALEEGGIELTNVWAEAGLETELQDIPPMQIGSVRLAVWDYSLPHIDLFTEPEGHGRVSPYHDDTIETGSFGIPLSTASIQVHSGVWLVFSDPGFQGMIAVLETGAYPFPETWGFPSPFVGSLRPLRMGTLKVENPNEVKAVVYAKPGFDGAMMEIDSEVFNFRGGEGGDASLNLDSVGSLKIIGGFWVGYSQPGFEGQQHILEEGEYVDCSDWGGSELLSIRPVLADFMSPHLKMFSDRDFGNLGVNIDLTVPVINMDDTGYGMKTQSVDVISGVWVVFEEPGFGGEAYILEKGLYGSPEDWGALRPMVASAMPVMLDDFENTAKFKVQLFSEPGFQGSVLTLEDSVASLPDALSLASCKVVSGSWLAFEGQDFTGRMYVLEVGSYPDLRAMGCVNSSSSIMSLQTVGFDFSLPSITLFERSGMRGKRVVLTDGSVNLQLAGGCSRVQSVHVDGGMWVLYEGLNYLGAQILLKPGDIPDWHKFCGWNKIGSLRPLIQKQVHFRVRNRQTGLMMSLTGELDDIKLLRIQEMEETDGFEQIWFYQNGYLHCKLLEECCLCPSGTVTMAGGRVGLTPLQDNPIHLWSITPEGFIRYTPAANLVLEVKGGHHFDKNQVILSSLDPNKPQQRWDVEII